MRCYVCDVELTLENRSDEHILINAAGGRLKSKDLICQGCNSDFGEDIDAALARQLNFIANQLMIKRERGEPQPVIGKQETTNEEVRILPDGSLVPNRLKFVQTQEGNQVNISFSVRDEAELKKVADGLVKKHPQLRTEDILKAANFRERYLDEALTFDLSVGGPDIFRAVCKCAVNYFVFSKGDAQVIKPLLGYIKGTEDKEIVWMHYRENLYELDADECFHMIHLRGNPTEGILYCYIDYFNIYKYIVLLSDVYCGKEIKSTYCYDVLNSKVIEKEFLEDYDRTTAINFFINKDEKPFDIVQKSFDHTLSISHRRQRENHVGKIIRQGMNNAWDKYPAGTKITESMVNEAVNEIMKKLGPFILHKFNSKKV